MLYYFREWSMDMKRIIIYIMSLILCLGFMTNSINATSTHVNEMSDEFVGFDENGNLIQYDTNELEDEVLDSSSSMISMATLDDEKAITYGVVNFRVKSSAYEITTYTNCANNQQGYLNGYTMSDGAYLGMVNGKVKFKAAGVTGLVDPSEVSIVDYSNAKTISMYKVTDGKLYHYIANIITKNSDYFSINFVGASPNYLKSDTTYYSYDGHYFYTNFNKMIDDYKNNVFTNAVNGNSPYYNYFQYLPARSKTSLTAAQFDEYTASMVSSGKLLNAGSSLISNQNTYGVNALIMYANAVMESGWGQSQIALDKNNLFGHGAADNNPYYGANGYSSVNECIKYHAKVFISEGYCDPKDASGRYYGSHVGDKESGINVKYGSDPYWGEKIAHVCWSVQSRFGGNEFNKYTLGIANSNVSFYTNPGSNLLFNSGNFSSYPIILLNKQNGYYKVQSDATLNSNRTSITQDNGVYNYDLYYAYIKADCVYALNEVKTETNTKRNQWVKDSHGNWYWYDGNANYVTGWKQIGSNWYYFNSSGVMAANQWIGNYYLETDGVMATNKWIGNCYVGSNGLWTPARWILQNGKYWYRHQDGSYTKNNFEKINGKWYLFDLNGYMLTGWQNFDNERYYFDGSGAMSSNVWIGNYYLGSNGKMVKNKWVGNYYLGSDGKMATNRWVGKYYVDANGLWQPDRWLNNGQWWYRYGDGSYPVKKFDVIGNKVYYFNEAGYMVTGWQFIEKDWYYFDASGAMVKNQWVGNYYLGPYGQMLKNQWIQNRYVGNDGKWVPNYS